MHTQILTLGAQTWADMDRQGIWRGEQFIPLPARAYQILLCLLRYPNHLLPEARLLQAGWPGELRTWADLFAQIYRILRTRSSSASVSHDPAECGISIECRPGLGSFVACDHIRVTASGVGYRGPHT